MSSIYTGEKESLMDVDVSESITVFIYDIKMPWNRAVLAHPEALHFQEATKPINFAPGKAKRNMTFALGKM